MRITIVTAFHRRPETTEIVCDSLARLIAPAEEHGIELLLVGVYDGDEGYREIIARRFHKVAVCPNLPISNRMNKACSLASLPATGTEPDAVLFIGGDNIINLEYLLWVRDQIADGADIVGPLDCYFYRRLTGEAVYWSGYTNARAGESIGAGRAISRRLLDKIDWQPWPEGLNRNLDGAMRDRIKPFVEDVRTVRLTDIGGVVLDIKDEVGNINDWHHIRANADVRPCEIPDWPR